MRGARRRKGLSRREVADLAGMQQSGVSTIGRGEGSPTLDTLLRLTGALKLELLLRPRVTNDAAPWGD